MNEVNIIKRLKLHVIVGGVYTYSIVIDNRDNDSNYVDEDMIAEIKN